VRITRVGVPVLLAAAIACSGSDDPPTGNNGGGGGNNNLCTSTATSIAVANNSFFPACVTVSAGSQITWTWGNTGGITHNVTFPAGGPNSPTQAAGTFSRTFATAGTYNYNCTVHGAAMSGRIVVE